MPYVVGNYSGETVQFAYKRKSVNYEHKETFHSHLGIELLWIHQGKGTMIVNNNSYPIKPGMFCMFQPFQLHHLTLDYSDHQSFERSLIIFEPTMFESYFQKWPVLHSFFQFIHLGKLPFPCIYGVEDGDDLEQLFVSMQKRLPVLPEKDRTEEISLFLVILFRKLKQLWDNRKLMDTDMESRRKNHQVEHILSWIEANYTAPYSLEEMAQALHLSPYHIAHLFKAATGITISDYIATRRIHQAVQLLTTTHKPVSLIAEEIGLMNGSYFCRLFKTHMGTTPYQYRKKWIGR
ncbi:AraC family transcriptional regulator [Paenibacillus sp. YN15]|uniref:AraC family transcriptional regulator n=1 Tax=Paenibacillus sp. YN15 TaxID=1742774 RepID=UPI000DCBEE54|nr:AraC family transcriptional regulator [Paenibacillus sp. YN15]RAU98131.1 AraC family transcriptional regulator [Paenibacillus sp. YN15]